MPKVNDRKSLNNLKESLGSKRELFEALHDKILSLNKDIDFVIFPIYIGYYIGEKVVALVYFTKKISGDGLEVGLNLTDKPSSKKFRDATHMKYPGITHSMKIRNFKDISEILKLNV